MRTIKFRAKRLPDGKWVFGDLAHTLRITSAADVPCIRIAGYDVIESTIGQFTGLYDKNSNEIFEGDIIFSQKCDCRAILHKVEYNEDNAMFVAKPIQGWDFDFCQIRKDWIDKYGKEVIGNIHDNPELLKGGMK